MSGGSEFFEVAALLSSRVAGDDPSDVAAYLRKQGIVEADALAWGEPAPFSSRDVKQLARLLEQREDLLDCLLRPVSNEQAHRALGRIANAELRANRFCDRCARLNEQVVGLRIDSDWLPVCLNIFVHLQDHGDTARQLASPPPQEEPALSPPGPPWALERQLSREVALKQGLKEAVLAIPLGRQIPSGHDSALSPDELKLFGQSLDTLVGGYEVVVALAEAGWLIYVDERLSRCEAVAFMPSAEEALRSAALAGAAGYSLDWDNGGPDERRQLAVPASSP